MVLDKVNNMSNNKQRPIGVFDSGVGGLTNVRALMERLPMENIVYFGDTARVPYGVKSRATIETFTAQIVEFLLQNDVKALVIATQTGGTARLAAKTRPVQPILAGTTEVSAFRRLALVWGVRPMMVQPMELLLYLLTEMHRAAKETGLVKTGDSVVCTAGFPLGKAGASNLVKVEIVP